MADGSFAAMLPDGRRLHLQEGPIDVVVEAFGSHDSVREAYGRAARRFDGLLSELCAELALLRRAVETLSPVPAGPVARRMHAAVLPFAADTLITPMAAVAGAVADEILAAMAPVELEKAYVNNGGDIALSLAPGASFRTAVVDRPDRPAIVGLAEIRADDPVRGIATSGWRGRSFSLGIADAVTVLADTAAAADAAATLIANAVDIPGHPAIQRVPARDLQPDSDLGDRPVTRGVGVLTSAEIEHALSSGVKTAEDVCSRGLIHGAVLHLAGMTRVVGNADLNRATVRRSFADA